MEDVKMKTTLKYKRGIDGRFRRYLTYISLLNREYRIKVFPVEKQIFQNLNNQEV